MLKKLLFITCFLAFSGFGLAQEKTAACAYSEKFVGVWLLDEVLFDLSGENLEEEGQAWKISQEEMQEEIKGKLRITLSPDGTGSANFDEGGENDTGYGYWKLSPDCQNLSITIDEEEMIFGVVAVDGSRLVLEMEDYDDESESEEEGEKSPPVKMVFVRVK